MLFNEHVLTDTVSMKESYAFHILQKENACTENIIVHYYIYGTVLHGN